MMDVGPGRGIIAPKTSTTCGSSAGVASPPRARSARRHRRRGGDRHPSIRSKVRRSDARAVRQVLRTRVECGRRIGRRTHDRRALSRRHDDPRDKEGQRRERDAYRAALSAGPVGLRRPARRTYVRRQRRVADLTVLLFGVLRGHGVVAGDNRRVGGGQGFGGNVPSAPTAAEDAVTHAEAGSWRRKRRHRSGCRSMLRKIRLSIHRSPRRSP